MLRLSPDFAQEELGSAGARLQFSAPGTADRTRSHRYKDRGLSDRHVCWRQEQPLKDGRLEWEKFRRPTGVALINIGDDGENSITINPGANADLTPGDLGIELFDGVSYLIVQLEVPEDTTVKAIEFAFEAGAKAIFNPAPAKELKDFPFDKVYLFTPNETEAEFYTGIKIQSEVEAESAAAKLRQMGVSNVIITLGKKGAYCSFTNFKGVIKGFDVDAVDTTAAGDVFNGALAVGLMRYEDLQDVIRFAHGASALSVTQLGAQPSIPSLQNVLSFTGLT